MILISFFLQQETGWFDSSFRQLSRGLITLAASLYKTKELRNFFTDAYEKVTKLQTIINSVVLNKVRPVTQLSTQIVEPCKTANWDDMKLSTFLECYHEAGLEFPQLQIYREPWSRYMKAVIKCIVEMY